MQTVGIIHAGLMIMTVHLDNPQGYVRRIRRGEVMEVPDSPENFPSILKILAAVLNLKTVIKETLKRELSGCMSTPKKAKNEKACAEVNDERPDPESPCPGSPSSEPLI
ncbi:5047_t:CDS:2 [Cetraspora pellucida]|uniref:5047_t:CDS:1 n=1 Tax=Cetraspora pellucida TaxID=1433469 RepID=A0ACA9QUZ6_9GLOM|nr:5047_t:CDS:2 [Cetraspora pellucida]